MRTKDPVFLAGVATAKEMLEDKDTHYLLKVDRVAHFFLPTNEMRLRYLLTQDPLERSILIAESLSEYETTKGKSRRHLLSQKPHQPRPPLTLKDRWRAAPFPDRVREQAARDFERLSTLQTNTLEYAQLLEYVNWVLDIPWGSYSSKEPSLASLHNSLNETHYGLQETKQHVLEHFAVEHMRKDRMGMVLCFVGPPGTGKTTLAKSIARASGRNMQHIALGGVRDESLLRGHRRTYVASRPGRLANCLKLAKTLDPLIVLDELDKLDSHFGSSVIYALLELLDPEQNSEFTDHYLEVPLDLSRVLFICTANDKSQIPPELADRIEFIEFERYSRKERRVILESFVLPRILSEYNIESLPIEIDQLALDLLSSIEGIRQIEQTMKKLLRVATYEILTGAPSISLDREKVMGYFPKGISSSVGFRTS